MSNFPQLQDHPPARTISTAKASKNNDWPQWALVLAGLMTLQTVFIMAIAALLFFWEARTQQSAHEAERQVEEMRRQWETRPGFPRLDR